jgi:hypothetical protein
MLEPRHAEIGVRQFSGSWVLDRSAELRSVGQSTISAHEKRACRGPGIGQASIDTGRSLRIEKKLLSNAAQRSLESLFWAAAENQALRVPAMNFLLELA